ncbi:hypothetical protein MY10362_009377 [Beauveria mimosiformis]
MMSSNSSLEDDYIDRFELPQGVGQTEDVERYALGGFHPVHLGDTFDQGRYRVVHKLGTGGFSTVWLVRDETEKKWVALKIIDAKHSAHTDDDDKSSPGQAMLRTQSGERFGVEAPRYIVGNVDFLSAPSHVFRPDVKLVDFDQCFPTSSPPQKMLGTPYDFLAPEVAAGLAPSPASDVWALGCCIRG